MTIDHKIITKEMNMLRSDLSPDQIRISDERARDIWNSNAYTREMAQFLACRLLNFD